MPDDAGRAAAISRRASMTEYLTDDWGFVHPLGAAVRELPVAVPGRRSARHRAVRQAVPARRPFHDVREGRVLLSREPRPHRRRSRIRGPSARWSSAAATAGSAEELLKYPSMQSVTLCEIDLAVIDIARKYLQDGPPRRVRRPEADAEASTTAFAYVRRPMTYYDLIVLDLTDPGGPSTELYTLDFYSACARRLTPVRGDDAAYREPGRAPRADPRDRARACAARSPVVTPYLTSIPLYGGLWMMACCSQHLDPREQSAMSIDLRISQRRIRDLQLLNGDTLPRGAGAAQFRPGAAALKRKPGTRKPGTHHV